MDIYVQSFLNSATKLTISVSTTTTISQLKDLIFAAEGTTSTIMQLYINEIELVNTSTIYSNSITSGTYILSSNNIDNLTTKEDRQIAKLELAQLRRKAGGDTTANYYRSHNNYDRDLLPTKYVGNDSVDNANPGGLQTNRPWIT